MSSLAFAPRSPPVSMLLAARSSQEPWVPVTVLMNRHGLTLQCGIFFFTQLPLQLLEALSRTLGVCQLAESPHSWLLHIHHFFSYPGPSQHRSPARWRSDVFLTTQQHLCRVLCKGFDTKAYCIQKAFSILLKHLALGGWLLNKMLKASVREHREEKCRHQTCCWMETLLHSLSFCS